MICVCVCVCAPRQTGVDLSAPDSDASHTSDAVPVVYGQAFYLEHVATGRLLVASQQFACGFDPDSRRLDLQSPAAVSRHHVAAMFTLQPRFKVRWPP